MMEKQSASTYSSDSGTSELSGGTRIKTIFLYKIKDVRLGSIRISNHQTEKLQAPLWIFKSERDLERKMEDVIVSM